MASRESEKFLIVSLEFGLKVNMNPNASLLDYLRYAMRIKTFTPAPREGEELVFAGCVILCLTNISFYWK